MQYVTVVMTHGTVMVPAVNRNVLSVKLAGWISAEEEVREAEPQRRAAGCQADWKEWHHWEKGAILEPLNYLSSALSFIATLSLGPLHSSPFPTTATALFAFVANVAP